MPRNLSTALKAALSASQIEFYHLVRFDFAVPVYYTTAPRDITYKGNVYVSNAYISKIPDFTETLKIKPNTFSFETSGVSLLMQALSLDPDKINTELYIYRHYPAVNETVLINKGFIDGYDDAGEDRDKGKSTISWKIANHWSNWDQSNDFLLTDANQQARFPGDEGLEYIAVTEFFGRSWGRGLASVWLSEQTLATYNVAQLVRHWGAPPATQEQIDAYRENLLESPQLVEFLRSFEAQPLPVVYGQRAVTGIPVYRAVVTDASNTFRYLHVVYALAAGECDSLVDIVLDDNVSYTDARYSSHVTATFYSGTDTQTADASLIAATSHLAANWTANHKLQGICYVYVKYTYDANVFPGGEPQPKFEIKGKKLYDPRTGSTAFSTSSPLVALDYLTSANYGKGLALSDVLNAEVAADYADTLKEEWSGSGTTITRQDFSSALSGQTMKKNIETILSGMDGYLPWVSGRYHLGGARDDESSVFSFDESNISGPVKVSEKGSKSRLNKVEAKYFNAASHYTESLMTVSSAAYLAADNNKVSRRSIALAGETNTYRARNRAEVVLKQSREQIVVDFTAASAAAIELIAGDVIDLTLDYKGWANKLFRITDLGILANGDITIKAREYEPSSYNWDVGIEQPLPVDTTLPLADLIIGSETSLVGTNDILSKSFFYHTTFDAVDGLKLSNTILSNTNVAVMTASPLAFMEKRFQHGLFVLDYSSDMKFKTRFKVDSGTGQYMNTSTLSQSTYVGWGQAGANFAVEMFWNSVTSKIDIYAGATSNTVNTTLQLITSISDTGIWCTAEAVFTSGSNLLIKITPDGSAPSIHASITTNLPGTHGFDGAYSEYVLVALAATKVGAASNVVFNVQEYMCLKV